MALNVDWTWVLFIYAKVIIIILTHSLHVLVYSSAKKNNYSFWSNFLWKIAHASKTLRENWSDGIFNKVESCTLSICSNVVLDICRHLFDSMHYLLSNTNYTQTLRRHRHFGMGTGRPPVFIVRYNWLLVWWRNNSQKCNKCRNSFFFFSYKTFLYTST